MVIVNYTANLASLQRPHKMPDCPLEIIELSPDQQDAGLQLALRDLAEPQMLAQVAEFRTSENAGAGNIRLWGALRQKFLTASLLVQTQPGRTAMLWPPRLVPGEPQSSAERLLHAVLTTLAAGDLRMVQVLLANAAGNDAHLLGAVGFRHFSDLLYLVCLAAEFPAVPLSSELAFIPVDRDGLPNFTALVEATYEGTLDCPAVNGLRSMDDVLQGYRATGKHDPQWWLFVRRQNCDVGCLIMTDYPQLDTCELIYMGLVPAARGQNLGVEVVRHALKLAAAAARQRIVLAVDAENLPALKMYAAAGFQAWDRKSVFIRIMPGKQ